MEIERKFLVKREIWEKFEKPVPKSIKQAYLSNNEKRTIRVRIKGDKGFLTIKGETIGITRKEFEYEIPYLDAMDLIENFSEKVISKQRFEVAFGNHIWEVDVFEGKLDGLIVAEIELKDENEPFLKPNWLDIEVSHDPQYYNSNLIIKC